MLKIFQVWNRASIFWDWLDLNFRCLSQQGVSVPAHRPRDQVERLSVVRPRVLQTRTILPTPTCSTRPLPQLPVRVLSCRKAMSWLTPEVRASRGDRVWKPQNGPHLPFLQVLDNFFSWFKLSEPIHVKSVEFVIFPFILVQVMTIWTILLNRPMFKAKTPFDSSLYHRWEMLHI